MFDLEQVKEISSLNCTNHYTYNGHNVPRVTEIISKMIHEDSIVQWANSLGFRHQSYTKTLNAAAVYGTKAHHGIEYLLKGKEIPEDTPESIIKSFNEWWKIISSNNQVKILGQEVKLTCEWFGGTYDLLLEVNGKVYLVDFKTSNHVTYKYCLQLAAYNYMLKLQGVSIDGIIILQLSKKSIGYNEFILNFVDPVQQHFFDICERTFLSLVYAYYHIYWLEVKFNEHFKTKR